MSRRSAVLLSHVDDELGAIGIINRMLDDDLIDQGHVSLAIPFMIRS